MRWEKVNIVALCSPPTKRSHLPHPGAWGEQMRKTSKIFPWNGMAMSPAFKHLSNERSSRRSASPLSKGDSHPGIISYRIKISFWFISVAKTKGESNCQTSFDAINLYILYLSTTSCQYWVAKPIRAQQEEKSATHLHQIILGSGKSTKRENGQTETVNGQTVKSNLHAQKPWPWHLGKRMKC